MQGAKQAIPASTTAAQPEWWKSLLSSCPSFTLQAPLETLRDVHPLSEGADAFYARIDVFLTALEGACDELCGHVKETEEQLTSSLVAVLLCGIVLQLPYLDAHAKLDAQPFRAALEQVRTRLQETQGTRYEDLHEGLALLLGDRGRPLGNLLKVSVLDCLQLPSDTQLAGDRNIHPATTPPTARSLDKLLTAAAERVLTLAQSRATLDALAQISSSMALQGLMPDRTVLIATHNPHVAERLVVLLTHGSCDVVPHLEALGQSLPANTVRSFDLLLRLDQQSASTSSPSLRLLLWQHPLPTYFSRCFAAAQKDDEELCAQEEGMPPIASGARVHESTSRTLRRLQSFVKGTRLLELAQNDDDRSGWAAEQLHLSSSSDKKEAQRQVETVRQAASAVSVELHSLSLSLVRYREASEMLRAIVAMESSSQRSSGGDARRVG